MRHQIHWHCLLFITYVNKAVLDFFYLMTVHRIITDLMKRYDKIKYGVNYVPVKHSIHGIVTHKTIDNQLSM